jgi:5'(3')-deoxyribonucleotidase
MTYDAAEKLLHSKKVANTAFQAFPINTLRKLCSEYKISVIATGQRPKGSTSKADYITAIFNFVSRQQMMC